ncbi:hypothetical protein [Paraburkholderia sp. GAS32]
MDDRARREAEAKTLTERTTSAMREQLEGRSAWVLQLIFGAAAVYSPR